MSLRTGHGAVTPHSSNSHARLAGQQDPEEGSRFVRDEGGSIHRLSGSFLVSFVLRIVLLCSRDGWKELLYWEQRDIGEGKIGSETGRVGILWR